MTRALHTAPAAAPAAPSAPALPDADTLVLASRQLRPGTDPASLSRFGHDRWTLTPALLQDHANATCIEFSAVTPAFRRPVKLLTWLLLNHRPTEAAAFHYRTPVPSVRTVVSTSRQLRAFASWLAARGLDRFGQVTDADLDAYAAEVNSSDASHELREDLLAAVFRAWTLRELMPEPDRLPQAPPWGGERIRDLLGAGRNRHLDDNRTPRIHPQTMTALLAWSLRFVEELADDIIAAFGEYKSICNRTSNGRRHGLRPTPARRRDRGSLPGLVQQLIDDYRTKGLALPGRRDRDGRLIVNLYHLGRQLDAQVHHPDALAVVENSGLPVDDDTYLTTPIRASLDGRPWRERPILVEQAPVMARHLATACFVITAYLSGQRPGETLNLKRGCVEHDPVNGLILLRGRHWKGVRDADGTSRAEGEIRADPWVVVDPVAAAVAVAERLHDHQLLFPNTLLTNGRATANSLKTRVGWARGDQNITGDIGRFIAWVNEYCQEHGRRDPIPIDPVNPTINASRLRRTLAWFIVRRPRGLVAAAIQYGHLRVRMTLGYSGDYASGFPDSLAFEEWLARLDTLTDAHQRLQDGEHVSGPAASAYRDRVGAATRFAGRVLRTGREAATLLDNPDLHIFPGKGMTCVLDPTRAACRLAAHERSTRRTPDLDDCRPACANIARTDRDVNYLRRQADQLQAVVDDPLAPPIRHEREQRELVRIQRIIADHDHQEPA